MFSLRRVVLTLIIPLTGCLACAQTTAVSTKACSTLQECAVVGDANRLGELLRGASNIEVPTDYGETVLFTSVRYERLDAARLLVSAKANVNARNKVGTTPLMMAVLGQNISLLELLLDAGADVNATDDDGDTVLMHGTLFVLKQTPEILRLLVSRGANVNAVAKDGRTALMYAAGSTVVDNVKALLALGANVNAKDNRGLTALDHAADIYETNPRTKAARTVVRRMRRVLIAAGARH